MITGEGIKKVGFVGDRKELEGFMLQRLLRRAQGLTPEHFYFIDRDDPNLSDYVKSFGIKVLIPLGEGSLRRLLGEMDILRWRGRIIQHHTGAWMVPAMAPSKLLPQRSDSPDSEIERNPPRFQGVWMRDTLKALDIAAHGFTRRDGVYLLDPAP